MPARGGLGLWRYAGAQPPYPPPTGRSPAVAGRAAPGRVRRLPPAPGAGQCAAPVPGGAGAGQKPAAAAVRRARPGPRRCAAALFPGCVGRAVRREPGGPPLREPLRRRHSAQRDAGAGATGASQGLRERLAARPMGLVGFSERNLHQVKGFAHDAQRGTAQGLPPR